MKLKRPGRPPDVALQSRRREEILIEAARLFAERGYSATDTQALVDRLGVGKGTLYRYFRTKEELFLAAADRVMVLKRRAIDASIVGIADPLERVARALRAYLDFFATHSEFVELLIQERAHFKDRKKPTYFEHRDADVGRWRDLFRGLIADGRVRGISVERITDVISDLMYGTMFTNYFAGQRKPSAAQAEDILDVVFHGILSRAERRRRDVED